MSGTTLTQSDTGTVTLASPASSYSNLTTLNAGILNFATIANEGSNSSLGNISAATDTNVNTIGLLFQGGTLQYTGSVPQSSNRQIRIMNGASGVVTATIDASGIGSGTGNCDNSTWSGCNSTTKVTNFSANALGTIDAGQLVGSYTDVVFNAASASTPVNSVLGSNFQINSLTFNSAASVSINSSNSGSNSLTLFAAASNGSTGSLGYAAGTGLTDWAAPRRSVWHCLQRLRSMAERWICMETV